MNTTNPPILFKDLQTNFPSSATRRMLCKAKGICGNSWNDFAIAINQVSKNSVSRQACFQWLANGVPAKRVKEIELATKGKIKPSDLRPDLFPISLEK